MVAHPASLFASSVTTHLLTSISPLLAYNHSPYTFKGAKTQGHVTMGFFNRRTAPADTTTTTATGTHEKKPGIFSRRNEHATTHHGTGAWNSRPTFGQWIKATALDIVTMAAMGAVGLGVYMAKPAPSRSFPSKSTILTVECGTQGSRKDSHLLRG